MEEYIGEYCVLNYGKENRRTLPGGETVTDLPWNSPSLLSSVCLFVLYRCLREMWSKPFWHLMIEPRGRTGRMSSATFLQSLLRPLVCVLWVGLLYYGGIKCDVLRKIVRLPRWLSGKDSTHGTGDMSSIPGSGRSLEKEMATLSSILAWRIPWTEKSDRLQLMGSQESHTI